MTTFKQKNTLIDKEVDTHFAQEMREILLKSEQTLNPEVKASLEVIRNQVITTQSVRRPSFLPLSGFKLPAMAAAFASVALIITVLLPGHNNDINSNYDDSYFASVSPDLYEELDFYQWLANNEIAN